MLASAVAAPLPSIAPPAGYRLGHLLAAGGSSVVYSVTGEDGKPAALKIGKWRDRDIHDRFAREAGILSRLGPPRTPAYLGHGAIDGWPYLLMEHVVGETLASWMARAGENGALGEIVGLLVRLARVLQALHDAGYTHRDLKPENVVIGPQGTRLLDFGLAVAAREAITQDGSIAGTVHYLAPEQLRTGAAIDQRADIYSFGVIAYEMLAGQPPFVGDRRAIEYQHQVGRPTSLRELRTLPSELDELVLACLAKQPEARPQTAAALIDRLSRAGACVQTLKGLGPTPKKAHGTRDKVVLAWIEGGDPLTISRAIADVHGIIVRSRPGAILAAFAAQFHDAPLAVARATCRALAHDRCRIVLHATTTLLRRSPQGKPAFYGPDIEQPASWVPQRPFTGLVLTRAAAEMAVTSGVVEAADVPGFWRDSRRDRTDATDIDREPQLVGRDRLLQDLAAICNAGGMLIGLWGDEGRGKTRVLEAFCDRMRAARRDVIAIRGRRRLLGDRPDDARLLEALGGSHDIASALEDASRRDAIIVIDDAHWFSAATRAQLVRVDVSVTRVLASRQPLFEVAPGETRRLAIALPALSSRDAQRLLRDLLEPARLIPDVLLERLTVRGNGNPGLLVALARDIKQRGGIRRQDGSEDWYVAADEIDTLPAAPSAAWLASRVLESLPLELAPTLRMAAGLGPAFAADELASVTGGSSVAAHLQQLVHEGILAECSGGYEFVDAGLQDAIYDHVLDERSLVHERALRYWLSHRNANLVGWLARVAHHAMGSGDQATAAACSSILAREARKRGEEDVAHELEQRALASLVNAAPAAVADAIRALDGPAS